MAANPRKRQKQKERRAAKRKAKQHEIAKEKSAGLGERLASASRYPVLHCWASMDLWDEGIGWVCLSRQLPNGMVAFAVFLVDRFCLGVKDAWGKVEGRFTYDTEIVPKMRQDFPSRDLSPATARKFVESAVEYARGLGFPPPADYHKAKAIFGDIDANESTEELEFGENGKPYFFAGPHDTPNRCRQILKTLEQSCGPGGYHFTIPFPEGGLPEFDEEEAWSSRDRSLDFTEDEDEDR